MIIVSEDEALRTFVLFKDVAREVVLEQFSKIGNTVRVNTRSALKSNGTYYKTRVGNSGAYLEKSNGRQFGLRESHSQDNTESNPNSMASMINSFLMEKSETLVVGGMNPAHTPILRRDGEVVGFGASVQAVGKTTTAILHRMDTGEELNDYNSARGQLLDKIAGRHFMQAGVNKSSGQIHEYLKSGFVSVMERGVNKHIEAPTRRVLHG